MYVARIPNRSSPPAYLLRESYRENGKVKNRGSSGGSVVRMSPAVVRRSSRTSRTSAQARQKGPPLPPSPSHRPLETRGEGRCDGDGGRGLTEPVGNTRLTIIDFTPQLLTTLPPDGPSFCPVMPDKTHLYLAKTLQIHPQILAKSQTLQALRFRVCNASPVLPTSNRTFFP